MIVRSIGPPPPRGLPPKGVRGAPQKGLAMSSPSTTAQFLELLEKSGLVDPQRLRAYLRRPRADDAAASSAPRALANLMVRDGLLTRFQAEHLLLGRWRHFVLGGKYVVLGPLGSGGMGQVYLCEHRIMRHRVAAKVLPAARAGKPASLERFHREARAVAQLRHPNIVGGYDVDRDGKVHFLVMEYIDGSTFQKIVKTRGPMDPLRAAHYVRQAALGLQHAYEAGLVHRDVKPSNLLLDRAGTVKILDMGLARFFRDEADDLSVRGLESPLGTADYIAPEQALDSRAADTRADIYSLGVTFYFLLAGHGPFRAGTALATMLSHQVKRPRPIRDLRPETPPGLAVVLERMMAKEPAERYQTPAEAAEALAPWTQTPIPPPPQEEMPEPRSPVRGAWEPETVPGSPATLYTDSSSPTPRSVDAENDDSSSGSPSTSFLHAAADPAQTPVPDSDVPSGGATPQPARPLTASRPEADETNRPKPSVTPPPPGTNDAPRPAAKKSGRRKVAVAAVVAAALLVGTGAFAVYLATAGKGPAPAGGPEKLPPAGADASPRLRLLAPAYFYPADDGLREWDRIADSPAAAATVVIVNPNSGPGEAADRNYAEVLGRSRRKGVTLIGYVSTRYAARPLLEAEGDVDRWVRFYPGIQGVFFDEQASVADQVPYYAALYDYARKHHGLALVVANPGTACAEEYLAKPAADVVCMAEAPKDFSDFHLPAWADRYPAQRFAALLSKTDGAEQMRKYVLQMAEKRVGYCYITDGREPNPWRGLPRYWDAEATAVQRVNERKDP
jgi:serine/threonine protein kinase